MKSFEQFFTEEKLDAEDRNDLDDSEFGIPETRGYPLNDAAHVKAAVRLFPHAPAQYKKTLARRILSRAKKFGLDTSKWESLKQYQESVGPEDDNTSGTSEFDEYNVNEPDDCYVESKNDSIHMRPATKADTDRMYRWEMESIDKELQKDPKVQKAIREDVEQSIKDTQMIMDGKVTIGMFTACMIDDGEWRYIGEIYLIPSYRGRGIGSGILRKEIEQYPKIRLQVATSNDKAIKLYKSLGFKIVKENKKQKMYLMEYTRDTVQESVFQNIKNKTGLFEKDLVYHISPEGTLDGQVFKPRVPEYLDKYDPSKPKFEDVEQPRVCFSPSIEGCLNAILVNIGRWKTADKLRDWYVYIPEKPLKEYKHRTTKQLVDEKKVYDANLTKEIWIEEPVRLKQYGVIRIDSVTDNSKRKTVPTTNGETEKRNYYDFKWHWLIKPKVLKDVKYDYSPKEVCKDMIDTLSDYKYGIPENGRIVNGSEHDYDTKWKLQSPEEFEKNRGGICYDYVEFEEGYLDAYGIKCKKYFISTDLPGNDTHTFILVDDGHGGYLYPESSFKPMEGVHEVKSLDHACSMVGDGFWKINDNLKNVKPIKHDNMKNECKSFKCYLWEYTGHPKYGSNMKQCMEYYSKGEPIKEWIQVEPDFGKSKTITESAKSEELIPIKGTLSDKYDYLYFGSDKNHMPEVDIDKGPLFVTPFKGLASIFAGSHEIKKAINEKYGRRNYNLSYKEWRLPENELNDIFKTVHVYVEGIPELEPFELEHEGFIHHIFTKDYDTNFYRYEWMSPTREYLIANTDNMKVEFGNVTKCKVRYIIENKSKPIKESYQPLERNRSYFRNFVESVHDISSYASFEDDMFEEYMISDEEIYTQLYQEYTTAYQEEVVNGRPSLGRRILDAIISVLRWLKNAILNLVEKVKRFIARRRKKKNINDIAATVIGESPVQEAYITADQMNGRKQKRQSIDYMDRRGMTSGKLVDDLYIEVVNSGTIVLQYMKQSGWQQQVQTSSDKNSKHYKTINSSVQPNSLHSPWYDIRSFIAKFSNLKEFEDGANEIIRDFESNRIDYKKIRDYTHIFGRADLATDKVTISVKDLMRYQSIMNKLLDAVSKYADDLTTEIAPSELQDLRRVLINDQMGVNILTSHIILDADTISPKYQHKIKTIEKLSQFVDACIKSGIPPKIFMYNTWLACAKNLSVGDKYKPVSGMSRFVLFPADKSSVIKIGYNGFGIMSNRNEANITELIKGTDIAKYFALIKSHNASYSVVEQERVYNDSDECEQLKDAIVQHGWVGGIVSRIAGEFEELQKHKHKAITRLEDLHSGNVFCDTHNMIIRFVDYGYTSKKYNINYKSNKPKTDIADDVKYLVNAMHLDYLKGIDEIEATLRIMITSHELEYVITTIDNWYKNGIDNSSDADKWEDITIYMVILHNANINNTHKGIVTCIEKYYTKYIRIMLNSRNRNEYKAIFLRVKASFPPEKFEQSNKSSSSLKTSSNKLGGWSAL